LIAASSARTYAALGGRVALCREPAVQRREQLVQPAGGAAGADQVHVPNRCS